MKPRPSEFVYRTEADPKKLLSHTEAIGALANADKEALGFIPAGAYTDAIARGRLIASLAIKEDAEEIAGYVLFGGVFPHARIQQIAVSKEHRKSGVASALISKVVSRLELAGFLSLTAAVADDLKSAQEFYEKNGFISKKTKAGGKARNRKIILRVRDLDTDSLFSILEPKSSEADLGLRSRSVGRAPLFVIDLNVLFDVTKAPSRPRADIAEQLMGAALGHRLRLAISPEFLTELKRTSKATGDDPILSLAKQLPRLPDPDESKIQPLAAKVHRIVFEAVDSKQAGSAQAKSDARHLALAALSRASGFITSDGAMLDAQQELFTQIGIDVVSLADAAELLEIHPPLTASLHLEGTDCKISAATPDEVRKYMVGNQVPEGISVEFAPVDALDGAYSAYSISEAAQIVGVSVCKMPDRVDGAARITVHVRPDHVLSELLADYLLDICCREACRSGPVLVELPQVAGQPTVRQTAVRKGFLSPNSKDSMVKLALGRPLTPNSWQTTALQVFRKTRLRLPEKMPDASESNVELRTPDGREITVNRQVLDEALGPTLIIWPGRDGVIIPIGSVYAEFLLGTSDQLNLFGSPPAAFMTRRTYFNSPRAASLMKPDSPVLFYESKRTGGRGAIIAAARIVDVTIMDKKSVPDSLFRSAVVRDLDPISASKDVLASSFEGLLRLPNPVPLEALRELGAVGSANLQTVTPIDANALCSILETGWSNG